MRLLFVSDTHLGLDLPARPRIARRRRGDDFFRCFEHALAPALAGEVDAVLHGGDLHYRSRVPAWLSEAALAPLRRIAARGIPVLLVPGNHERSRLPYPLLALHENLHVFHAPRTVHVEAGGLRVAFAGFPYAPDVRARLPSLLEATRRRERSADVTVLCIHQCVEGATCGPGDFTFRDGADVIQRADLPADVAAVLSGHIHRHQVLRAAGGPPVVYAGSVERTSFAEVGEPKVSLVVELDASGLAGIEVRPLPARPMVIRPLALGALGVAAARAHVERAVRSTPLDAVVQLRLDGPLPPELEPLLAAPALRAIAGERTVSIAGWLPRARRARERRPRERGDEEAPRGEAEPRLQMGGIRAGEEPEHDRCE
jgi:exonuclease SbcD